MNTKNLVAALARPAVLAAGLVAFAVIGAVATAERTQADTLAGQFSLADDITPATADVGNTFDVVLSLQDGANATCAAGTTDPGDGCYQAVTFVLSYQGAVVSYVGTAFETIPNAASCNASDDTGLDEVTAGCVSFSFAGPDLYTRGTIATVTFTCDAAGAAAFSLTGDTSVALDLSSTPADYHAHDDSVTCQAGTGPTNTPTSAPTGTPNPNATPTKPARTQTATPAPTHTPEADTPTPPPPATTPPPSGATPPTGAGPGGGPGGVIAGPDTGTGDAAAGSGVFRMWIVIAAAAAAAAGTMTIAAAWRRRLRA